MNNKIRFAVDDMAILKEESDNQLAIVEIYVCHDGNNAHDLPISLDVLKKAAPTLKNKFLVAGFDGKDFEGHEEEEQIIGFFPESSKMRYVKKDGRTYLVAEAILSKIYADWAYDAFVKDNYRSVSMEIGVLEFGEEDEEGKTPILSFVFNGVTVLGKNHLPACEGANASIIKFSCENALQVYNKSLSNRSLNEFIEDYKNKFTSSKFGRKEVNMEKKVEIEEKVESDNTTYMDGITINNKKDAAIESDSWENPGKSLYEPLLEASNKEALVKEAYLVVEDGYEDAPSEHLKYPHHTLEGDELVVNKAGLEAAFQRASQEGIVKGNVKEHLLRHYKELGLNTSNFETSKDFEGLTVEQKNTIFRAKVDEILKDSWLESFDDTYIYVYNYEKHDVYRYEYTLDGTECFIVVDSAQRVMRGGYVPFECKDEGMETRDDEKDGESKDTPEPEDTEEEDVEREAEDDVEKDMEVEECENPTEDAEKMELKNKVAELEEKLACYEKQEKDMAVEAILAEVMECVSAEKIDEFRKEAENYSLEEMGTFKNMVNAAAFENIKGKKETVPFTRMDIPKVNKPKTGKYSW